jgi:hypothetical protein
VVLIKKVPSFRTKPELTVGCKGYSGKGGKRDGPAVALRKPIVADVLNEFSFEQGLTTDEIKNNGSGVVVDEVRIVPLIQIEQIVYDLSTRFDTHVLGAFVVLIAVRTPQIASACYLKGDISAERVIYRNIIARV